MTAEIRQALERGSPRPAAPTARIEWLDGIRALAASYVVLHHVWLLSYGGYPGNAGPWTVGWLVFGHLAVAVFIVVSGFSLTLGPSRKGYILREGSAGFIRRRFWRIVPPFWCALAFASTLVGAGLIGTPSGEPLGVKDILINALLIHDAVGNVAPNGVFWSIAVEWHIYFLFPLLLWSFRRMGPTVTAVLTAVVVAVIHVVGSAVPAIGMLSRFTPQFLALFVFGMLSVWLVGRGGGARPWIALSCCVAAAFIIMCVKLGSAAIVGSYFWIDLLVGVGTLATFTALAKGHPRWLGRILGSRPLAFVGEFAFSLYLVHAPVLELVRVYIVKPAGWSGDAAFWGMLGIGAPLAFVASYGFFLAFERLFIRVRSWREFSATFTRRKKAVASV